MVGLEQTGTCGGCVWGVLGDTGACTCRFEAITLARQSPSNNLHDYHWLVFRASELKIAATCDNGQWKLLGAIMMNERAGKPINFRGGICDLEYLPEIAKS